MSRSIAAERRAGFTLIEVLVALSIVATTLSSIGALLATSVRGTRSIEGSLTRLETARAVATALPARDQLAIGEHSGELAGHRWRLAVSPFAIPDAPAQSPWLPLELTLTVASPAGAPITISTVRLRRRPSR